MLRIKPFSHAEKCSLELTVDDEPYVPVVLIDSSVGTTVITTMFGSIVTSNLMADVRLIEYLRSVADQLETHTRERCAANRLEFDELAAEILSGSSNGNL